MALQKRHLPPPAAPPPLAKGQLSSKGQLSADALLAFAALLSALSILVLSAAHLGEGLGRSSALSAEEYSLSFEALSMDTAAGSLHGAVLNRSLQGAPSQDGRWIYSRSHPSVRQRLFHKITESQGGLVNVQQHENEPV